VEVRILLDPYMDKRDEKFLDALNAQADTLPIMTHLYSKIMETREDNFNYEDLVTLMQAAFWNGVEVGASNDYEAFRDRLCQLHDEYNAGSVNG
jgi:hypothetical protein